MAAVITEDEKARARHHLGYGEVESASTFNLGIPAAMQTAFMIEGALNRILPSAAERFRKLLCQLDATEDRVFCGTDLAEVDRIDTVEVNRQRLKELAQTYKIAQQGLANLLQVVPNPFDMREWLKMGGGGINVAVGH